MKLTNVPLIILAVVLSIAAAALLIGISPIIFAVVLCCILLPKILIFTLKMVGFIFTGTAVCCKTALKLSGFALKTFGFLILLPFIIIGTVALLALIII